MVIVITGNACNQFLATVFFVSASPYVKNTLICIFYLGKNRSVMGETDGKKRSIRKLYLCWHQLVPI